MCVFTDEYVINEMQHVEFCITLGPSPPVGQIAFWSFGNHVRSQADTSGDMEYRYAMLYFMCI